MSLIREFPEVSLFFQHNSFSQEELNAFIAKMERKYTDKQVRKSFHTLIQLRLLKYKMSVVEEKPDKEVLKNKKRPSAPSTTKVITPKARSDNDREQDNHQQFDGLSSSKIAAIALRLQLSISFLLNILRQKGIHKEKDMVLAPHEF